MVALSAAERGAIASLYDGRLGCQLDDHAVVGWGSRADQWLRFEQLFRGLEIAGRRILDVGCGLGALVEFLDERAGGEFDYLGVDLAPGLVRRAQERVADRQGMRQPRFAVVDILDPEAELGQHDLVVLSGALSYRVEDNEGLAAAMIERMAGLATEAVALNFLSSYVDYQLDKNFHYSPEKMFRLARTLCPRVALYHDYPLYEFTLQLRLADSKG